MAHADLLVGALSLLALVQTFRLAWAGSREARRIRRHRKQGRRGEVAAETALRRAGYEILEHQPTSAWTLRAEGRVVLIELCPDFLVQKRGQLFVADAKTGKSARIEHAATRRQLLEYWTAFDVDGVLLVGPQGVERIEF